MAHILTPVALATTRALRAHPRSVLSTAAWTKVVVMDEPRPGESPTDYPLAMEEPDNDSFGEGIFTFIPLLDLRRLSPTEAQRRSMESFFEVLGMLWSECDWDMTILDDVRQSCIEQGPDFLVETTKRSPDQRHRAVLSLRWSYPGYVCTLSVLDRDGDTVGTTEAEVIGMSIHDWSDTRRSLKWLDNNHVQAHVFPKNISVRLRKERPELANR